MAPVRVNPMLRHSQSFESPLMAHGVSGLTRTMPG